MGLAFGKTLGRVGMWLAVKYHLKWRMRIIEVLKG